MKASSAKTGVDIDRSMRNQARQEKAKAMLIKAQQEREEGEQGLRQSPKSKKGVCFQFKKTGMYCTHTHTHTHALKLITFNPAGSCSKGSSCRFSHDLPESPSGALGKDSKRPKETAASSPPKSAAQRKEIEKAKVIIFCTTPNITSDDFEFLVFFICLYSSLKNWKN